MALLVPAVVGVLLLTLSPQGTQVGLGLHPLCFACGEAPLANIVRNVILFMPMGLLLGRWLGRSVPVLLLATLLSAGIETAQFFIPGRNPLLIDVMANGAGGWLGALLGVRLDLLLHPRGTWRRILRWGASSVAAGLLLFSGWALSVDPPTEALTLNVAPVGPPDSRPGADTFPLPDTRVHEALFGGEALSRGPHSDSGDLARRIGDLFSGTPGSPRLEVAFTPGVAPRERGQILVRVHSGVDGREAMALSVSQRDLHLAPPLRASALSLVGPSLRWPDALEGWMLTDTLTVTALSDGEGAFCLELEGERRCERLPSIADGWSLLHFPGVPGWGRALLTLLWVAALFGPAAFWSRNIGEAVRGALPPAAGLLLFPLLFATVGHAPVVAWLGLGVGIAFGQLVPKPPPRTWPRSDDRGASPTPTAPYH